MPWVGVRRDFAAPEKLLSDLLVATARHSDEVVPGFAVFLADGEPAPFRHILAIVDRSDGPISGLLAWAAVAVADTAGAQLDILVIGDAGENPHTEDARETLVINREQELYDAAVERARGQGLRGHVDHRRLREGPVAGGLRPAQPARLRPRDR